MIYKVVKVIKNDISDNQFIDLCKCSFRKHIIVCTFLIVLCISLQFATYRVWGGEEPPTIVWFIAMLSLFPGFIALMHLAGNMAGKGLIIERMECKSLKDWVVFAERQVCDPKGIILTKRLMSEDKEVVEVCLDSKELRCKNTKTGNVEIFCLDNPFKEEFVFKKKSELADDEIILDLSDKELIAYLNEKELIDYVRKYKYSLYRREMRD